MTIEDQVTPKDRAWRDFQAAWRALAAIAAAHEAQLGQGDRVTAELSAAALGAATERFLNAEWNYRRLLPL